MIVAERKPFEEIAEASAGFRRVLVAGCGTCVAVCLTGGEKEAGILAAQLDIAAQLNQREQAFEVGCVERQCDREFLDELAPQIEQADAVLSLACGAGIQFLAEKFPEVPVLAGVNTTFIGINDDVGVWQEKCRSCRDCVLTLTGGICPMSLCPKGMLNGPCGGSDDGKCETDPERDCAWALISARLERTGRLGGLEAIVPARDCRNALPGKQVHPAYERRYSAHE
ncbi:MAG: methylenetetrahydrofolate reductase C-terminal domain-containing protein [Desulfarculaceae bacterium]|nr:methylenetetrahydrofolate reductase C-terminal domain-containing protein [Desulfarculaceae bacterium]MCF8073026.1 methylenetetrahydrofolate reductase C-terminal domain-containing protein [Desulfarculaceae bacterium]MCF8101889.1 methylenetetrahydrofolate reductase C-terminal domain-containing protein [Desulfarculaceae bacterium]MCF8115416.1 methylenetetrahydrofolate reductase C-terminal domain-containing protein [Desulfarculaceae bacterium]